jgi:hypothetical protein
MILQSIQVSKSIFFAGNPGTFWPVNAETNSAFESAISEKSPVIIFPLEPLYLTST